MCTQGECPTNIQQNVSFQLTQSIISIKTLTSVLRDFS